MNQKYLIGQAAHILNVSKDTLRYYDRLGIISPKKDDINQYRYYSLQDLLSLSYVLILRDLDISLDEIRNLVTNSTLDEFAHLLTKQETIIAKKLEALLQLKKRVAGYQNNIASIRQYYARYKIGRAHV